MDTAEAMVMMLASKFDMSLESMSRSVVGILLFSCATTMSMTAWRSGVMSSAAAPALEPRSASVVVRI